ncbi:hypothetical protein E4O92_12350 [Massilia horti]|uniref:Uncharacterized protein n=1 Tax=Massilia horti TaxID=2562153 RepID=A0A4Y9T2A7_9BURK|nr:hypothetical protein E4O92_12350 [Massilia horti]
MPNTVTVRIARPEPHPAPAPAPAPAAPTVHVTIGRVEVRALPAAQVTRPRPATLSLEQFLAQQGSRGKR